MQGNDWFKDWFDTKYYHLLYNKRNEDEALDFITRIARTLQLPAGAKVADIACGKGRHSRVLSGLGYNTVGFDLSHNSIAYAQSLNTPGARFYEQDMRLPYPESHFNAAFNLFTSFGYFQNPEDDIASLLNIYNMLDEGGFFIQDYLNGAAFTGCMPLEGEEKRGEIFFNYKKDWVPPFIEKKITVHDGAQIHHYEEKVKVYSLAQLEFLHLQVGFEILHVFGDYELHEFDETQSPRIIVVSKKPNA